MIWKLVFNSWFYILPAYLSVQNNRMYKEYTLIFGVLYILFNLDLMMYLIINMRKRLWEIKQKKELHEEHTFK